MEREANMSGSNPWHIQKSVVTALFLREMQTRFGSRRLGYLWAILEPAAIIAVFWIMFGLSLRKSMPGVDYPMFLMTGMLPFHLFSKTVIRSMQAFKANQGLFNYRQVKPIDTLVARCMVECLIYFVVFLIFVAAGMLLGFDAAIDDILGLGMVFTLFVCFSFSTGLLCAVIGSFSEGFENTIQIMMRPLFFASGIFFAVSIVPVKFRWILLLNPVLHFLELIRTHYFATFLFRGRQLSVHRRLDVCRIVRRLVSIRASQR
jgi:capsular polysaccharide transport system permease protein